MKDSTFHLGPEELDLWLDGRLPPLSYVASRNM